MSANGSHDKDIRHQANDNHEAKDTVPDEVDVPGRTEKVGVAVAGAVAATVTDDVAIQVDTLVDSQRAVERPLVAVTRANGPWPLYVKRPLRPRLVGQRKGHKQ